MGTHSSRLQPGDSSNLCSLIAGGNKSNVEKFLTMKGISVNTRLQTGNDTRKTFPLHVAVNCVPENCHHDLIEYFISKGANLNVLDSYGFAPLHYAARRNNSNAARALLEAGANVNVESDPQSTACAAKFYPHYYVSVSVPLHILLQTEYNRAYNLEKFENSSTNYLDLVKVLLSHGADCNIMDFDGPTPLHYAVQLDDTTLADLLLDADANVNGRRDHVSDTPIFHAKTVSMLKLLLSRGANIETLVYRYRNVVTPHEYTLLIASIFNSWLEVTRYLVAEMPMLLEKNRSLLAITVADSLVFDDAVKIIHLLIKAGCDPATELFMGKYRKNDNIKGKFHMLTDLFTSMEKIAPRSLLDLCIIRIRGILKKNISSAVETLSVPTKLKQMLTLKN